VSVSISYYPNRHENLPNQFFNLQTEASQKCKTAALHLEQKVEKEAKDLSQSNNYDCEQATLEAKNLCSKEGKAAYVTLMDNSANNYEEQVMVSSIWKQSYSNKYFSSISDYREKIINILMDQSAYRK